MHRTGSVEVFRDVLGACKELPRPDAKIGGFSPLRMTLYAVMEDEQHVQGMLSEIEEIASANLKEADLTRDLFKPCEGLSKVF